jgi:sulfur carrier protein
MLVTVNGDRREVPSGATVASVVDSLADPRQGRGIAVALEGEVVPRTAWAATELADGSHLEIVAAVQGG